MFYLISRETCTFNQLVGKHGVGEHRHYHIYIYMRKGDSALYMWGWPEKNGCPYISIAT